MLPMELLEYDVAKGFKSAMNKFTINNTHNTLDTYLVLNIIFLPHYKILCQINNIINFIIM